MDEQFEKDLKKRITDVFDNFTDNSADEGWQRLREKFPEEGNKRAIVWLWWSSAAAVVLVLLGILWLKQTPEKQQQFTATNKPVNTKEQPKSPAAVNMQKPEANPIAVQQDNTLASNTANTVAAPTKNNARAIIRESKSTVEPGTTLANAGKQLPADNGVITPSNLTGTADQNPGNPSNNVIASTAKPEDNNNSNSAATTTAATSKPEPGVNAASNPNAIASAGNDIPNQKNDKPGSQMLAYNNVSAKQKGLSGDGRVHFGVYAATFFNYAKGSANQFNIGAGVTADVKISKKLKLSTGIAIAQNSLSYGGHPVTPVPQGINLAPLALYSANTLQFSMSEPSFKSYNANLVGIDIPVNLKYTFDPGKSETYLLAGLSSGTFLNESYTYNFNGASAQNQTIRNGSGGFYFGRMLNLAIGTGYRFGANRLIIEPFIKYPLDGMGAQQIRFGSGGVNLRFSIPSIRK